MYVLIVDSRRLVISTTMTKLYGITPDNQKNDSISE